MQWNAKWIKASVDLGDVCPVFYVDFTCEKEVQEAHLSITSLGVYEAELNGERVGDFVLAPGWTLYKKRLQVQKYDVTKLLEKNCADGKLAQHLQVSVGSGWYMGRIARLSERVEEHADKSERGLALTAMLEITYKDGSHMTLSTDEHWKVSEGKIRFADLYDGEIYDAGFVAEESYPVTVFDGPNHCLLEQQGEIVREQDRIFPIEIFKTPAGETVLDFGQNVTGYVETNVVACKGDKISLSFGEVLDKHGNFYNANYRSAKSLYEYTCVDGSQTYKPQLSFYGFRYVRINAFPGGTDKALPENFTAIAVHSDLKRTGWLKSSNPLLNKLFENIIWGQKGNFLDVPTDCPQRDERLGWTGDAQVFIRTACLNYDVERFFTKWLADVEASQQENGAVGHVVPVIHDEQGVAAWDDAAVICPWNLYLAYGNKEILQTQFNCMEKWISYITNTTTTPYLWTGGKHYGDWLGLDAKPGSYKGATRDDFLASAFYAYSTELLIKAGKVLGKDMHEYEVLYESIVKTFRETYPTYTTQTECILAAHFKLAENPQTAADQLAEMVKDAGTQLMTGFVGTPYLLHVLSDYGYTELAYSLLLRTEYPSWLYQITKGATTVWEHWDGIMENGDFWSTDMNSYNHYAYGAVADWVYCQAAGINTVEAYPGYEKVCIAPQPDARLDWLEAVVDTRRGRVSSKWYKQDDVWRYEISTPVEAEIVIAGKTRHVAAGNYVFYSKMV